MIINSWNDITLVCGNHGEDYSNKMQIQNGPHSLFYACPQYKSIFGKDHSGRSCNNRLTLVDFEKMLDHLTEKALGEDASYEADLTGYRWSMNGVDYKVLKHKDSKFVVAMLNRKAIAK